MRYSLLTALAAGLAIAAPLEKRDGQYVQDYDAPPGGDVAILNYALTLEYLERNFYMGALAKFKEADFVAAGFKAPFYANLKEIYVDELTHVSTLAGALTGIGATPVHEATYKFPYTDVKSFVGLSAVLEGVGVSAYIGAAAAIVNPQYLTVAGTILTIEARHASYIRAALGQSPFPKPFDTPLDFNRVYSLAAQFITGFAAGDAPLPFKAFPALSIQASQYQFTAGTSSVTFTDAYKNALNAKLIMSDTPVYAVFFSGLDIYYTKTYITHDNLKIDKIPAGDAGQLAPTGQVYVVLSTADGVSTKVNDANTISGVGILEVNPVGMRDANW